MSAPLVSDQLLAMLRCPVSGSPLVRATNAQIAELNARIAAGTQSNRGGDRLEQPLRGGLINADRTLLYPVYEHGPTLIADEAIELLP
jgi:uncharacterized protein YbaR (Trm112 family)